MLRILPLADGLISPQARQEIYLSNRIGRFLPVKAHPVAGQIRCKQLVRSNANGW